MRAPAWTVEAVARAQTRGDLLVLVRGLVIVAAVVGVITIGVGARQLLRSPGVTPAAAAVDSGLAGWRRVARHLYAATDDSTGQTCYVMTRQQERPRAWVDIAYETFRCPVPGAF